MYQQFCVLNSTANFTANFTQSWSREPFNLSYSEGHYHVNDPLHSYVTKDGRVCVGASITLYNISSDLEIKHANGNYKVIVQAVSSDCAQTGNATFRLNVTLSKPKQQSQIGITIPLAVTGVTLVLIAVVTVCIFMYKKRQQRLLVSAQTDGGRASPAEATDCVPLLEGQHPKYGGMQGRHLIN